MDYFLCPSLTFYLVTLVRWSLKASCLIAQLLLLTLIVYISEFKKSRAAVDPLFFPLQIEFIAQYVNARNESR